MKNKFLAERVLHLEESSTIAMSRRSKELQAKGIEVINLSIGEPDFKTPDFIRDTAKFSIESGHFFSYPPSPGYMDLRKEIAKKFREENSIDCTYEQVIVSNGAKQAISNVFFSILNPGDEVIIFTPYWVSYDAIVRIAGGKPVFLEGHKSNGFKITSEQLRNAISSRTKAIIFSSPCNPTGAVFDEVELRSIAKIIEQNKHVLVVADEIYEYINYKNNHFSIGSIKNIADRVITINGFSKAFAMTGWRLGYLLAPKFLADKISDLHGQISFGACTISQRAGLEALQANLGKIQYMIEAYKERRDFLLEQFKNIHEIEISVPDGAFYLFPDISKLFGKRKGDDYINDVNDFTDYILNEAHVALVAGDTFGNSNCIRLSYASSKENLLRAVDRIKIALSKLC